MFQKAIQSQGQGRRALTAAVMVGLAVGGYSWLAADSPCDQQFELDHCEDVCQGQSSSYHCSACTLTPTNYGFVEHDTCT